MGHKLLGSYLVRMDPIVRFDLITYFTYSILHPVLERYSIRISEKGEMDHFTVGIAESAKRSIKNPSLYVLEQRSVDVHWTRDLVGYLFPYRTQETDRPSMFGDAMMFHDRTTDRNEAGGRSSRPWGHAGRSAVQQGRFGPLPPIMQPFCWFNDEYGPQTSNPFQCGPKSMLSPSKQLPESSPVRGKRASNNLSRGDIEC